MSVTKPIPPPPWTLDHAHKEILQVAKWARQMGYVDAELVARLARKFCIAGNVVPMVFEICLARNDSRKLESDHIKGLAVNRPVRLLASCEGLLQPL